MAEFDETLLTGRATNAMRLAGEAAGKLGHHYLDDEHIMLGLVREGTGIAASILRKLGDEATLCREIESRAGPSAEGNPPSERPRTPRAKMTLEYASGEAKKMQHRYVGTEHILLGLMKYGGEGVKAVLRTFGSSEEQVRDQVLSYLGIPNVGHHISFSMQNRGSLNVRVSGQILGLIEMSGKMRLKVDLPPWDEGIHIVSIEYVEYAGPGGKSTVTLRRGKRGSLGRLSIVPIEIMFA
jgi:hypothetical protein